VTLLRLVIGWAAVALWFLLFELVERRLENRNEGGRLRASWKVYAADALIFTLFASLWFASLGHGGWLLLFLLLGLLIEGPGRFRDGRSWVANRRSLLGVTSGVGRTVVAGGILALWL
jgi:hypothetical protein